MCLLGLGDGFVGAGAFASAAVDAFVGVDYVSGITGADCTHGADIGAGTAADTKVGIDDSCHSCFILIVVGFFCGYKNRHYI